MRIIISPAKKMNVDTDSLPQQGLPVFLSKTKILLQELQNKDLPELKNFGGAVTNWHRQALSSFGRSSLRVC